jgi:PhnB protein
MRELTPYLAFAGDAREAMGFYRSLLGGSLDVVAYRDFPEMPHDAADDDRVMHAYLKTDDGLRIMAAETPTGSPYSAPASVTLTLGGGDEAALTRCWDALADGGTVHMPLEPAPWGGSFGSLTDRYGVPWYVMIDGPAE